MSKAKVYVADTEVLETSLDTIAGRVKRRVEVEDVLRATQGAESLLSNILRIAKKDWGRVTVRVNPQRNRQPSAQSYGHTANAVEVVIRYQPRKGWYVDASASAVVQARRGTVANRRDFFVSVPSQEISHEEILEALGVTASEVAS